MTTSFPHLERLCGPTIYDAFLNSIIHAATRLGATLQLQKVTHSHNQEDDRGAKCNIHLVNLLISPVFLCKLLFSLPHILNSPNECICNLLFSIRLVIPFNLCR